MNSIMSPLKDYSATPVLTMSIEDFHSCIRIKSESIVNNGDNDRTLTTVTNNNYSYSNYHANHSSPFVLIYLFFEITS